MPLFGTLTSMPLPDLLQWLGNARTTGTLQVEHDRVSKTIVLRDGKVIGCTSDDPPQRLGQVLLARGAIDEPQLRAGLAAQRETGRHLGALLVEAGAITADELTRYLETQAEETIYSLFDWTDAIFRFREGDPDLTDLFPVSLRVEDVLLRGLQRFDEMQRIRETIPDNGVVMAHTSKLPPPDVLANRMARALYQAVDGERSVGEILYHVHGSEFVVLQFLYELIRSELIRISGSRGAPGARADARAAPAPEIERPATIDSPAAPTASEPAPAAPRAAPRRSGDQDLEDLLAGWDPGDAGTDAPAEDAAPAPAAESAPRTATATAAPRGDGLGRLLDETQGLVPIEQSDTRRLEADLESARQRMSSGEFEEALEVLDRLYREYPGDESLRRLTAEAEAAFIEKAYRHFLPPSKIPILTKPLSTLESENLSPAEFFLLSRIDGAWDVRSIIQVAPMRESDALRTLKRMRESGTIKLSDPAES